MEWCHSLVRLFEYQGKELLKKAGIAVPEGGVASTPLEAMEVAEKIGKPVVVKAQIWATGRFKAGGIKFAENPEATKKVAEELLGAEIKGFKVDKVLVEERLDIDREFYVGIIVDDSCKVKAPVLIFSTEGGVDIEEVAKKSPEKIARMNVDVLRGIRTYDTYNLVLMLGMPNALLEPMGKAICGLYKVFRMYDARAAEINPLVLTKDEKIYAADCRITIDDSSVTRHPNFGIEVPRDMARPPTELEKIAWKIEEGDYRGTSYFMQLVTEVKEPGYIGFHGIGGGGTMKAAASLLRSGLKLANYADTSGNPTASKVYRIVKVILSQPRIEGYILAGATMASQEQWHHAHGVVKALREDLKDKPGFPVIILIAGNKEEESHEIVREGLKDLPIRLEVYGREYVNKTDFIAERMKVLVEEYRKEKKNRGGEVHA